MKYSQGICGDGAAILQDGLPLTPERIIEVLNRSEEWQPIETAPKDWTYILGFEDGYGIQITFWDKGHDGGRGGFRTQRHGWRPTHWMPLPKLPSA